MTHKFGRSGIKFGNTGRVAGVQFAAAPMKPRPEPAPPQYNWCVNERTRRIEAPGGGNGIRVKVHEYTWKNNRKYVFITADPQPKAPNGLKGQWLAVCSVSRSRIPAGSRIRSKSRRRRRR